MISRTTEVRQDGAVWQRYDLDDGQLVVTSRGRELFDHNPEIWDDLKAYRQDYEGSLSGRAQNREFFAAGSNARVYKLNADVLVREAWHGHSSLDALDRMDKIQTVIEEGVPRWIAVPTYFGALATSVSSSEHQFTLMERIDAGITVKDIKEPESLSELERRGLTSELGPVTEKDRKEVVARYEESEQILHNAIAVSTGNSPLEYLTDWHEQNVVVERLSTPIAGSNFKLWLIDQ